MNRTSAFCLFLFLLLGKSVLAQDFGGKTVMNGISLSSYKNFEKTWKLVTVRYREDSGEMRWTYANDIAWKALKQGAKAYPDGAVFAKVGVATQMDPGFLSSRVPSGARRTQFMVMNRASYPDTDGWGYALFNQAGLTFPDEPKLTAVACHACHRLVPERNFVFSQIVGFKPDRVAVAKEVPSGDLSTFKLEFSSEAADVLPELLKQSLPPQLPRKVRMLKGELAKHIFDGTVDEVRPLLAKEADLSGIPAVLLAEDKKQYSMVYPLSSAPDLSCAPNQKKFGGISSQRIASGRLRNDTSAKEEMVRFVRFCLSL